VGTGQSTPWLVGALHQLIDPVTPGRAERQGEDDVIGAGGEMLVQALQGHGEGPKGPVVEALLPRRTDRKHRASRTSDSGAATVDRSPAWEEDVSNGPQPAARTAKEAI
jgi:hypothetical protein